MQLLVLTISLIAKSKYGIIYLYPLCMFLFDYEWLSSIQLLCVLYVRQKKHLPHVYNHTFIYILLFITPIVVCEIIENIEKIETTSIDIYCFVSPIQADWAIYHVSGTEGSKKIKMTLLFHSIVYNGIHKSILVQSIIYPGHVTLLNSFE